MNARNEDNYVWLVKCYTSLIFCDVYELVLAKSEEEVIENYDVGCYIADYGLDEYVEDQGEDVDGTIELSAELYSTEKHKDHEYNLEDYFGLTFIYEEE